MKHLFVLTLLLCGLSSCKKITHADTEIRGQVINQTDNSPLVGYQVHLVETETPPKPFTPLIIKTLDTKITDANGRFDFGEWDLSKRSRFDYTVQFDPNGEEFASQDWKREGFERVNQEENVKKGQRNDLILLQVPFGKLKLVITNNSSHSLLEISAYLCFEEERNPFGTYYVNQGESERFNDFFTVPAGASKFEIVIKDHEGVIIDTSSMEIQIPHNQKIEYEYVYE